MALVPYRRRNYDSAFPAPGGVLTTRNVRPRYTQMMGMARYGSLSNNPRGSRYGRYGGYRTPFSNRSQYTHPVYPRPEVKAYDYTLATNSIDNTGTLNTVINQIPNGTGLNSRIGNQIATKSVYYQYVLNFGSGPVPNAIRHILYWDKQANGTVGNDLLASTPTGANLLTAPMNLSNRDRYVILADERTTLSPNGDQIRIISGFRKINQRTDFPANNTQTIPITGALCFLFVSDETVVANEPTVYGTWRIRYIDC